MGSSSTLKDGTYSLLATGLQAVSISTGLTGSAGLLIHTSRHECKATAWCGETSLSLSGQDLKATKTLLRKYWQAAVVRQRLWGDVQQQEIFLLEALKSWLDVIPPKTIAIPLTDLLPTPR